MLICTIAIVLFDRLSDCFVNFRSHRLSIWLHRARRAQAEICKSRPGALPKLEPARARIPLRKLCGNSSTRTDQIIPHSLAVEINQAYRYLTGFLKMTNDAFYTLVVLLVGSFVIFLCAVWFIERRGDRRRKAKRERRKFKL
jgi:hypothetical protein